MNRKASDNHEGCKDPQPLREYSRLQVFVNNLPYIAMVLLGAAIFVIGFENSAWGWIAAAAYLTYGAVGVLWIAIFMCPYCPRWNTHTCPCGYGRIAARFQAKKGGDNFKQKFKKHIPVIVPLWFIPVLAGAILIIRSFSWPLLVLLVVFALDAFIILPQFSKKYSCVDCPQRDSCPWMGQKCQRK